MWRSRLMIIILILEVTARPLVRRRVALKIDSTILNSYHVIYPMRTPPVILTPYIESDNIEEAQKVSAVRGEPFPHDIPSYSGFFTVNKTYNSNLFFWLFPAEEEYETAPLLLWLQGGPGSSSMFGLFTELGPFSVAQDNETLLKNPYSWHKKHSIIFIDNPVGTGFSFTDNEAGYSTDEYQIGIHLYSAITQFLTLFPELQKVPFFIAGQSYGGKYATALGYTIHHRNPTAKLKINFKGLAVGNGLIEPITQLQQSDFVYQLGLVDTNIYNIMKKQEQSAIKAIKDGRHLDAIDKWISALMIFQNISEQWNFYNYLTWKESPTGGDYERFLQQVHIRGIIHVGDTKFSNELLVKEKLESDFMKSVRSWLELLLNNYRVMCYNGQADIMVPYASSVRMYNTLNFSAAQEYRNATRVPWKVDGELAGYMKSGGNFTEVMVRNAGHMVPTDQPKWAFDLIYRFTRGKLPSYHDDKENITSVHSILSLSRLFK